MITLGLRDYDPLVEKYGATWVHLHRASKMASPDFKDPFCPICQDEAGNQLPFPPVVYPELFTSAINGRMPAYDHWEKPGWKG